MPPRHTFARRSAATVGVWKARPSARLLASACRHRGETPPGDSFSQDDCIRQRMPVEVVAVRSAKIAPLSVRPPSGSLSGASVLPELLFGGARQARSPRHRLRWRPWRFGVHGAKCNVRVPSGTRTAAAVALGVNATVLAPSGPGFQPTAAHVLFVSCRRGRGRGDDPLRGGRDCASLVALVAIWASSRTVRVVRDARRRPASATL